MGGRRVVRTAHWPHGNRHAGHHVCDWSRRIHRHRVGQGSGRPSAIASSASRTPSRRPSACAAPERSRSWATCSSRVRGRTRLQLTGSFTFHRIAVDGSRVTRRRAASITRARVLMDAHLLDAVAAGATRRIVYVADTSCYGATGPRPITEDAPPRAFAWGRCLTPALERLDGYFVAGQPIVAAFPGWVYGNGGWFRERVIEPVMAGRRVLLFGKTGPWLSPIHVEDCARALVHLAERGEPGGRYFLVNHDPIRLHAFAERSPGLRTVHCVSCECPPWPPGSWSVRFSPTTSRPMRCSRTSDCAGSASASSIPRSSRGSSKSSEPSMSNGVDRRTVPLGTGESFDTVGRAAPRGRPGIRVSLLATFALVAIVSVDGTIGHAQVAQGTVGAEAEASGPTVSVMNLDVTLDPFTLRPAKGASRATRLAIRWDRSVQPPAITRPGARARSKTRIVAGAILGSVGGFFAGGFLGAHIEGDRCNCDDPGVRGFLIGAPIGAVVGGIVGGKLLF